MPLNHNFHYKQDYSKNIYINKGREIILFFFFLKRQRLKVLEEINTQCVCCDFTAEKKY